MSRYVVGIDLGTTNCALAYIDASEAEGGAPPAVRSLPIPQVVGLNDVGERPVLPSFLYLPGDDEFPGGAVALPWEKGSGRLVGEFARSHGGAVPDRLVSSAKSWLSVGGADRRAALLPRNAPQGVTHVSPVEASAAFLAHLRDAWDQSVGKGSRDDRLVHQEILLTVPASFDAVARELTAEAARSVGLEHLTLLEEPQAAFYAWLAREGERWRDRVSVGDRILVCDVGGGTTDLTLIVVAERDGDLALERLAVGEHILLGGDNMDLALAHALAATLPGGMEGLDPTRRVALVHAARMAKESLFSDPSAESVPVSVLGRGSKVIGGALKTKLTREQLNAVLLDGFFPRCEAADAPARGRRIGLAEIGLPFAADPAITRHLASFLSRQGGALDQGSTPVTPSVVLFNGGVFRAEALRSRVAEVVEGWGSTPVRVLDSAELDLAVARGAAYYGLVRRGRGVRIRGGVPRSYYVGIETPGPAVPGVAPPIKALCVVPKGMEEGTEAEVPGSELGLIVGEAAEFRFLASTVRPDDPIGAVLDRWPPDELRELDPLEATLDAGDGEPGDLVPVRLRAHVTEVGTLDLWCEGVGGPGRWKLEYNVREGPEG